MIFLFWSWVAISSAALPDSTAANEVSSSSMIPSEEMLKMRDPFKRPEIETAKTAPKTPLEIFSVDTFKMIGVLTGPEKMRALLRDQEGKTHIVSETMRIGTRGGVIQKITDDAIYVREKIVNVLGQEESVDSAIPLMEKGKRE